MLEPCHVTRFSNGSGRKISHLSRPSYAVAGAQLHRVTELDDDKQNPSEIISLVLTYEPSIPMIEVFTVASRRVKVSSANARTRKHPMNV
jgi:hypothetical protein